MGQCAGEQLCSGTGACLKWTANPRLVFLPFWEGGRQLKAELRQAELLVLTGITEYPVLPLQCGMCAKPRSEGKAMLGSRNWSEARC